MSDIGFNAWVEDARAVSLIDAAGMMGLALKKASGERVGPCPDCRGEDRFAINLAKSVFNCRGCGITGTNAIDLVMKGRKLEFIPACEFILNCPAPNSKGPRVEIRERDPSIEDAEKDRDRKKKDDAESEKARKLSRSEDDFESGNLIFGTKAEKYYRAREITITVEQAEDLRFFPARPYWHEIDGQHRIIGEWPCIVAAARDRAGGIAGLHLTYLDRQDDMKAKVVFEHADGRKETLPPRKMRVGKGLIRLGPIRRIMAIGEATETTLAWGLLGRSSEDFCLGCAGDLGHLSGRATANIPHPRLERGSILNGEPDMNSEFMAIPPGVEEAILLGDGDWNHEKVKSHLLTAARRLRFTNIRVSVDLCPMPPEHMRNEVRKGWDWNDILIMRNRGEAV